MGFFVATLNQTGSLLLLIAIGFLLVKVKIVSEQAASMLAKLETWVFLPAMIIAAFAEQFTIARLGQAGRYFLAGSVLTVISVPIALVLARFLTREAYRRRIYTYGLAISNLGFMGNAVVSAVFPSLLSDYLIFTLPINTLIYAWAVPALLLPKQERSGRWYDGLRSLWNPTMISMVVGILLGLLAVPLPSFVSGTIASLGSCMSPVAMLLTGMTVAGLSFRHAFRTPSIYVVTGLRLLILPLLSFPVLMLLGLPAGYEICTVCVLAMPLGLNTIVIPNAYGLDTSIGAEMALISHIVGCVTIPLLFALMRLVGLGL